ncbi:MAG TPA: DUF983 domain-containing protein [Amphiplicatus sp.]|nr:DUF983 domain-containing protein [Amphiplicatus sp.]
MAYYPPISPYAAGLACKCPRCGQGALFKTFLGVGDHCEVCGLDYSKADPGDGAIVFVLFIVGFVAVAIAFVARFMWYASIGVSFLISRVTAIALTLAMLRPLKATLIALQFQHKAEEGRIQE